MTYSTKIGDSQPAATVCANAALPIPVVTLAELSDSDDPINNSIVSGKKRGAMLQYSPGTGLMEVVVAVGPATTDKWVRLSPQGASTALTLTTTAGTDTAAHIAAQLNLIENAVNAILDGNVITPS